MQPAGGEVAQKTVLRGIDEQKLVGGHAAEVVAPVWSGVLSQALFMLRGQ